MGEQPPVHLEGGVGRAARAERLVPLTVLRMSMAMVMGPTPPGTGVILEATSLQPA